MSRIGKQPVLLSKEVKATISDGSIIIEGPKGKLSHKIPPGINVKIETDKIIVTRDSDTKQARSLHGTFRALIANMVRGVKEFYKKELDIVGVGFKGQVKGKQLILTLGFSHPVTVDIPQDLKVSMPNPNRIVIEGIDLQLVNNFAANIRRIYKPEPYKGKGIRYVGEEVRKKLGKALAKQ
ncbi:MAG: 50S ribosomal protein L6 [Candidatus Omnitrophica bacterium]|nr:50S ribosomal protein L6 [Candidatus Omnitrophota bacterium]